MTGQPSPRVSAWLHVLPWLPCDWCGWMPHNCTCRHKMITRGEWEKLLEQSEQARNRTKAAAERLRAARKAA